MSWLTVRTSKPATAAIEANRLSPDLIPAAIMAAQSYIAQDNARYAARVLTKTWTAKPHPDLAAAFAEIAPNEDATARLKRFKALTKQLPDHPETKMLLAELNIAAEDFPAAKRALGDLVETDPTARSLTLMAAIERGQGADDVVVRGWLARALTAPRGPQWLCGNCQHIHPAWSPTCDNCASFDTLSWTTPPASDVAIPAGTEMLPLIVGQIADQSEEVADVVEAEVIEKTDD
jgi:HemY protein